MQSKGLKKEAVEQAIQELTLSQHVKGASNLRAQMEAAYETVKKREMKAREKEV